MADESRFAHDGDPAVESDEDAAEQLATPQQWAAMTFAPVSIDPDKFGAAWEQARGAVARTAIEVLGMDDQVLTSHFMAQEMPLLEAMETYTELQNELE